MVFLGRNSGQTWSLFIHLLLLSMAASSSSLAYRGTERDRDSLLAFKAKIFSDTLGILSSWNDSAHFCHWDGVTCGSRHRRVTVLDLQSQQLKGTLSPHIGNLSFLRTLNLQNNNFRYEIPQELGGLFRLVNLVLENNSFDGEIPANLSRCSNLVFLSLGGNDLGGKLPSELGFLSKLQVLSLYFNNFVGEIPLSFGNLSSLVSFAATRNNLHGSVPSTFGRMKRLTHLIIGANQLSGPVPPSVFNLSSLTILSLAMNQFNGSLPPEICLTLPNLEILQIHTNQFSGPIPTSISNASSLSEISIALNRFSGKVPSLGSLHNLRIIGFYDIGNVENDDLNFMSSLVNCTSLEDLDLSSNNFVGEMPQLISNFSTKIRWMTFGRNQLRGSIPTEIGNLVNLEALGMQINLLTGAIPSSVGKLQKLNDLFFNGNKLSGSIPSALGNLTSLGRFSLRLNNLQGHIPSSLGGCQNLLIIGLSQNNLSGTIPKQVLSISSLSFVELSENHLTGSLPQEVGKLVNLGYLDVSGNNLFGEIPETLGSCTSLEGLFMERNLFQGEIPSSLSSLRGLQRLDLSHNNLSGQVPKYFEGFISLLYLNLSFNDFEGEIPIKGVFSNASAISTSGNMKLCGGIPILNLPMCTSEESKKQGISSRLKLIISLVCGIVGVILMMSLLILYRSRKNRKISKSNSSMGISIPKLSYEDLLKATDGYSPANLIGVGGFASVYKGILGHEGLIVAVKVFNLQKRGASKSFMAECEALRSIRHRNLVKILTACSSVDFQGNDFKALVYEFMINGSLEDWLHPIHREEEQEQKHLNCLQRINIAIDVAKALDYLHNDCQVPIIHCDLKPSNILLDDDMTTCVGDFGLAKLCPEATHQFSSNQTSSFGIKGSIGYAAPEYGMGSEASTYGDVYSYGILLLEMFSGKRPTDSMFKDGLNLHNFAMMALPERVVEIGDPILFQIYNEETINETTYNSGQFTNDKILDCLTSVVKIGVACSDESPRERMNIRKVVAELHKIRDNLLGTGVHGEHHIT